MKTLISPKRAKRILERYDGWIRELSSRYGVPVAAIKAILYQEMTMIDLLDPIADLVVRIVPRLKGDSSTGFAQIFGRVGLEAANYAVDHGLASYENLGLETGGQRLDPNKPNDVRLVWKKLSRDPKVNMELATANLLVAADEVVGRTDFESFTDEELELVLTRYNADTHHITPYGEAAFARYREFLDEPIRR